MKTWNNLLEKLGVTVEKNVLRIVTDSREVKPGDLFVAINTGCRYIDDALNKGAVLVVSQISHPSDQVLLVGDAVLWLGQLASLYRETLSATVIGITGSVGKTSLSKFLGQALSKCGNTVFPQGSFNNEIGVPITLLAADENTTFLVVEMGVAKPGDMDYLVDIVKPSIVIVTEVGPTHLRALGSREGVWEEKQKILRYASIAILNADSIKMPEKDGCRYIWFGRSGSFTIERGAIRSEGKRYPYELEEGMEHRLYTYAAAHAVFSVLSLTPNFSEISWPSSRLERKHHPSGAWIIDDCYNANFTSYVVALKYIVKQKNYKIILGEMGDLGKQAEYYHMFLGRVLNYLNVGKVIMVGKLHKMTMQVFLGEVIYFPSTEELKKSLVFEKDTNVLLKGSRHLHLEEVLA